MIPDAEKIVGAYLRASASIKALGARIVGTAPSDTDDPWCRVTQLDAPAVGGSRTEHLIEWLGQFDCYAGVSGGQAEASTLTRTVRAALATMHESSHEGAVVTGVRFVSCPRLPDSNGFEPARERFALSAVVYMHGA